MARLVRACVLVLVTAFALAMPPRVAGQAWQVPRTSWGHADLEGTWSTATITPLERPADLAGKEFFTEKEAAEYERLTVERTNRDQRGGDAAADVARAYNDFWWDSGTRVVPTRRTSLIVDPPEGRWPSRRCAAGARKVSKWSRTSWCRDAAQNLRSGASSAQTLIPTPVDPRPDDAVASCAATIRSAGRTPLDHRHHQFALQAVGHGLSERGLCGRLDRPPDAPCRHHSDRGGELSQA